MSFSKQDYQAVLQEFSTLSDEKYKRFNESLIPGTKTAYGVRVPEVRRLAKQIVKNDAEGFLAVSRPDSFEEIQLRGIVIASMKTEMSRRLALTEAFFARIVKRGVGDKLWG